MIHVIVVDHRDRFSGEKRLPHGIGGAGLCYCFSHWKK
jgi:hypothetical protein